MIKLNRKIEYALMALQCLDQSRISQKNSEHSLTPQLPAKEIADKIGAPFEVAARVLQTLSQHQWVDVEHGSRGGYRLGKSLENMTMKDLIEIIDGPLAVVKCQQTESVCEIQGQCKIASPMQELNAKLVSFCSEIKLKDLLGAPHV